ncbi:hypothetical protein Pint_34827 [Pistacia integerrima]|uniref:Uncharacterized protein n=1 Tax=Pistacia integerrima TaxID=434235 RepID=A0ACC0X4H5_9ROSI|nr:hypothetical protein Pint_34827 [Pistacia integerrima]
MIISYDSKPLCKNPEFENNRINSIHVQIMLRFHHLKLYPEDESGPMSTKKPVVVESYDEIVFTEPSESFLARVQNHPVITLPRLPAGFTLPPAPTEDTSKKKRGDTKDHPLGQWFMNFSEADELLQLAAARQQELAITILPMDPTCSLSEALDIWKLNILTCSSSVLGASSYCKTETTDKFDRWAAATVEINLRPVTVYYSCNFWRCLLQIDFAAKPCDSIGMYH